MFLQAKKFFVYNTTYVLLGWAHQLSYMCGVVNKKKDPPLPPQGSPAGSPAEQVAPSGGATSGVGIAFVFFPSFSFLFNSGRSPREFFLGLTRKNTEQHWTKNTENTEKHGRTLKTNTKMRFDQKKEPDLYWLFKNKRKHEKKDGWMDGRFDRNTNFDFFGDQISSKTRFRTQRKKTILAKFSSNI